MAASLKKWNIKHSFNLTSNIKGSSQIMPKKVFFMVMTSSMTSRGGLKICTIFLYRWNKKVFMGTKKRTKLLASGVVISCTTFKFTFVIVMLYIMSCCSVPQYCEFRLYKDDPFQCNHMTNLNQWMHCNLRGPFMKVYINLHSGECAPLLGSSKVEFAVPVLLTHWGRVTPYGDGSMLCKTPIFFTAK